MDNAHDQLGGFRRSNDGQARTGLPPAAEPRPGDYVHVDGVPVKLRSGAKEALLAIGRQARAERLAREMQPPPPAVQAAEQCNPAEDAYREDEPDEPTPQAWGEQEEGWGSLSPGD